MKKIFIDFDGTLIDNSYRQCLLLKNFISINKKTISYSQIWKLKRQGLSNLEILKFKNICNKKKINFFKKYWFDNIEKNFYLKFDFLYHDTIESLQIIYPKYKLFLLSGRSDKISAINQVKYLKIDKFFSKLIFVNPQNIVNEKRFYLELYKPHYYIGDTELDFFSSRNTTNFLCVNTGQRNKSFLKKIGISNTYDSLIKAVKKNLFTS